MQVYVCAICMVNKPPLFGLSTEHWPILEAILWPAVNLDKLTVNQLMTCYSCKQLLVEVHKFRATALVGVRHLLSLLAVLQKKPDAPQGPLLVDVKQESEQDSLLEPTSFIEVKLRPDNSSPRLLEPDVKPEPPTTSCESDLEDSIPATPIHKTACLAPPARHTLTVLPLKVVSGAPRSILNTAKVMVPRQNRVAALQNNESKSATFTHQPLPGRGGASGAARGGHRISQAPVLQTMLQTVQLPRFAPKPTGGAPAATEVTPVDTPPGSARSPPFSPWYKRVIKEAEILAERSAARGAAEFVGAALRCEPCVLAFRGQLEADEHSKLHLASAGDYECQTCTQRLPTIKALQKHRSQHGVRYFCFYCRYSTADEAAITRHSCDAKQLEWESSNFTKTLDRKPRKRYPKPFKCKECYCGFAVEAALIKHMDWSHKTPSEPQTCTICSKQLKNKHAFRQHMYAHKRKASLTVDDLRPELYCTECQIAFTAPSSYRQHMRSLKHATKDTWKFQCDECGNKFISKFSVSLHIQAVHNKGQEHPFKCDKCPKSYLTARRLRLHAESHAPGSRPRPHVCHRCGKAFTIRKSLVEHLLMHEGLRPHACPLCPATFTFSAALYTHNRLKHLNIKRKWKKKPKKGKKDQEGKKKPKVAEAENLMELQADAV